MKSTPPQRSFQEILHGRLLYQPLAGDPRFVLVESKKAGLWIVPDGWTSESRAAGPFKPDDALRAWRLANVRVPQGCELGPWQDGLGLFEHRLPGHSNDWSRVEPAWLDPSLSPYSAADIEHVVNEACHGAPADAPRVDWGAGASVSTALRDRVARQEPALLLREVGVLARGWNVHPKGSPLFADAADLSGSFVIVDVPPIAT
jgi:hypothetical protein